MIKGLFGHEHLSVVAPKWGGNLCIQDLELGAADAHLGRA